MEIGLPEIARDLPSNFKEANNEFKRRVQETYSNDLSVAELTKNLRESGFEVNDEDEYASISRDKFPCKLIWRITWTNDLSDGINDIKGIYGGSCL